MNLPNKIWMASTKRINLLRIFLFMIYGNFDIIFIQRALLNHHWIKKAKKQGKKIVFDFDDAIYISDKNKNAEKETISSIRMADLVITSCPVLQSYARNYNLNSIIITSAVDTNVITPENPQNSVLNIGWIGSSWTTKYLSILEQVFKKLSNKYKFRLMLMGAGSVHFECETKVVEWRADAEVEFLKSIDIGIMPLFNGEYEKAKGGYKLFQYMAAGKPVLASPVGINNDIVVDGENGYLCANEQQWLDALVYLFENKEERKRMGNNGREMILSKYSLELCAAKLIENLTYLSS